jgi:hypothetical protein
VVAANDLAKTEIAERIMTDKFNMSGAIFHFTVFDLLCEVVLRLRQMKLYKNMILKFCSTQIRGGRTEVRPSSSNVGRESKCQQ